jgi:hypothetical protein
MRNRNFISPSTACQLIARRFQNLKAAQSFLLTYAGSGAIYVSAEKTFETGKNEAPNKRIPADIIRQQNCNIAPSFWKLASWKRGQVEYTGIQFDRNDVLSAVSKNATGFGQNTARHPVPGAGRASGKHGEPIATLTLRYRNVSRQELNRLTGAALEGELKEEYIRLGYGVPSEKNRESICVGLLRAIKRYQDDDQSPQKS